MSTNKSTVNGNNNNINNNNMNKLEELKKIEDRRKRNRESAAKCRQKLKDKLNRLKIEVKDLDDRKEALNNEMLLLKFEKQELADYLRQHKDKCQLNTINYNIRDHNNNNNNNNIH
jgi:predicted  nucleic acid-binding Zn-ribbon protein